MDPGSDYLFFGEGQLEGIIGDYAISPIDGSLGTVRSFILNGENTGDFPTSVVSDPSGDYLYVTAGIAGGTYSVGTGGALTLVSSSGISSGLPDPEGTYIYTEQGNDITVVSVNPANGALTSGPSIALSNGGGGSMAITGLPPGAAISGPFPQFSANQVTLAGTVTVGMSEGMSGVTMINNGHQPLLISSIAMSGADPLDFSPGDDCPVSLAPAATCTFNPLFTPQAAGTRTAAIVITDNGPGGSQSIALTATGVAAPPPAPAVTFVPGSVNFATSIPVGSSLAPATITLMRSGDRAA